MDEAMVRKRCEEIYRQLGYWDTVEGSCLETKSTVTVDEYEADLYRAAYADGLEAAAKIIQEGRFMQDAQAVSAIRQHAKEMGHE